MPDWLKILKDYTDTLETVIGLMDATATADDLSDITTTDVMAKLRRILLRFSADAFSSSIDGSARTDLESVYTALGVLLGTRDATVSAGVLVDTESVLALLRRLATSGTLVHFGDITAVDAGVSSTIADLIGWEDDYFVGWWMTIVRDDGGAGAAPQGEYRMVTSYTSTTGLLAHVAFSAADVVGDQALLIHPVLYAAIAMRGGTETLESIDDELDAIPDMAKVPASQVCVVTTEHTLPDLGLTGTTPMYIAGIWLGMENAIAGDVFRWRVFVDWDDSSIADQITDDEIWTFSGLKGGFPSGWVYMPLGFWVTYEIRVKVTQLDGGARTVHAVLDSGVRGA